MALPWGVCLLAIALVMAAAGLYGNIYYPDEKPSVRVIVPMFGLFLYLVLALLFNWRTSTVTPKGLSVSVWPFPVRPPRRLTRDKIRHCYIRNVRIYDEDGTVVESYYSTGVESALGEQTDISYPYNTAAEAAQFATRMASELNRLPGRIPIEVRKVKPLPETAEAGLILVVIGVWLALFIAAIFVGIEWEERSNGVRRQSIGSVCSLDFASRLETRVWRATPFAGLRVSAFGSGI